MRISDWSSDVCSSDLGNGDEDRFQGNDAVGVAKPARLPNGVPGMVFQKLDPPFGHHLRRDAQDGEARLAKLPIFVLDRPPEVNRVTRSEIVTCKPHLCRLPGHYAARDPGPAPLASRSRPDNDCT